MSLDYQITTYPLTGDHDDDDTTLFALKAPAAGSGGGLTILEAYVVEDELEADQGVGTAWAVALHKYSSAGTPALNGTIAAAVGGTADLWVAGVPKTFTIDADYAFVDAGEWVAIEKTEENSNDPNQAVVIITWVRGRNG
jgi:hypothetical protein